MSVAREPRVPEYGVSEHSRRERPGRTLRLVLLVGFGGLLVLAAGAGVEALTALRRIQTQDQQARAAYITRSQSLLAIRSSLDECDSTIEAYFLGPGGIDRNDAAPVFQRLFLTTHRAVEAYPPTDDLQEKALLTTLAAALEDQENAVALALQAGPDAAAQTVFTDILPSHQRIAEAVRTLAERENGQMSHVEAELLESYATLRTNLTRLLMVILVSGLFLAVGSIAYILRQDREARERHAELAGLSARLLDVQEEERRAISRELHDEVGQSLSALLVDIGQLSSAPPGPEQIGRMKSLAERSVNSVRNMALLLRPSMLDDLGLVPALEWQAREVSRRSEMEVEVESSDVPESLSEDQKICIYRVTQEALNNAARHAGARNARVNIAKKGNAIALTVHDDGHGFDTRSRGLGLLGMEERVRRLGGQFRIESQPNGGPAAGSTIEMTLPL